MHHVSFFKYIQSNIQKICRKIVHTTKGKFHWQCCMFQLLKCLLNVKKNGRFLEQRWIICSCCNGLSVRWVMANSFCGFCCLFYDASVYHNKIHFPLLFSLQFFMIKNRVPTMTNYDWFNCQPKGLENSSMTKTVLLHERRGKSPDQNALQFSKKFHFQIWFLLE